jgi:hypothetical protein
MLVEYGSAAAAPKPSPIGSGAYDCPRAEPAASTIIAASKIAPPKNRAPAPARKKNPPPRRRSSQKVIRRGYQFPSRKEIHQSPAPS